MPASEKQRCLPAAVQRHRDEHPERVTHDDDEHIRQRDRLRAQMVVRRSTRTRFWHTGARRRPTQRAR